MGIKLAYFCSSNSWGGLEMNHLRNALWMSERGHEVVVLGLDASPIHTHTLEMGLPFIAIQAHRRWYDFKAARRLAKIISSEGISHLLIRKVGDMSIAAGIKHTLKDRIHVSYFMEMQLGIRKKSIFHTIRYRRIDVWSCPLDWLQKQVEIQTNFTNKLVVIPSGIRTEDFADLPSKETSRAALNVPKQGLIFGMAGRFDPKKGQLLLLEALVNCKDTDFLVLFMGATTQNEGSEYVQTIHRFIQENGLENRIIFRPHGTNLMHFYRSINWMVMASDSETVGMVTIESLASGTPVLGSNAGGTPEILGAGAGGILFETKNSSDLAVKIDSIIDSTTTFDSAKLIELAKHYDHRKVCSQVEEVLGINSRH